MATIGNLVVRLTATTTDFERSMQGAVRTTQAAAAAMERQAAKLQEVGQTLTFALTLPLAAAAGGAVYLATQFQAAMELVHTQASATQQQVEALSGSVLGIAGQTATSPDQLAAGLFHLASAGGVTAHTMEYLQTAAEGAKMGGADLESVTNALNAAMVSGISGISSAAQAMGALNATVGAGDMHMQDLADALGTGVLASIKGFGVTMQQAAAALAVFGDNNIRGAQAGTELRMAVQALSNPVRSGASALAAIGLNAADLRTALAEKGLGGALDLLTSRLQTAGVTGDEMGDLLTQAFGRKAGVGIQVLAEQVERFHTKLGEVSTGSATFAQDWIDYTKTAAYQFSALKTSAEAAGVALGKSLLPFALQLVRVLQPLVSAVQAISQAFQELPQPVQAAVVAFFALAAAIGPALWLSGALLKVQGALATASSVLAASIGRLTFAFAAWRGGAATLGEALLSVLSPTTLIIAGIVALVAATVAIATHWRQFSAIAQRVWGVIAGVVLYAASLIVRGFGLMLDVFAWLIPGWQDAANAVMGYADALAHAASVSMNVAAAPAAQTATVAQQTANASNAAAQSQQNLANGLNAAAAAAKNGIQSFDQVHQIQDATAGIAGGAAAALAATSIPAPAMPLPTMPAIGGSGATDALTQAAKNAENAWRSATSAITGWWSQLVASTPALKSALDAVNGAVGWIVAQWPRVSPIVRDIASVIAVLMVPALIRTGVQALVAGGRLVAMWILAGLRAAIAIPRIIAQMILLGARYMWLGVRALAYGAKAIAMWALQGIRAAISIAVQIGQMLLLGAQYVWLGIQAMASALRMAAAWVVALGPVAWVAAAIIALAVLIIANWQKISDATQKIWTAFVAWLSDFWKGILALAYKAWNDIEWAINHGWEVIRDFAKDTWNTLVSWLEGAWNGIGRTFAGVWHGIESVSESVWRNIVQGVKDAVNFIIDGINTLISAWDNLQFTMPKISLPFGGSIGGGTISVPQIPQIPRLASGGIVTSPMLAEIGESGPEAVVPLGQSNFADAIGNAVFQAVRDATATQNAQPGSGQEIVLQIDGRKFARLILPKIAREQQRLGARVVGV